MRVGMCVRVCGCVCIGVCAGVCVHACMHANERAYVRGRPLGMEGVNKWRKWRIGIFQLHWYCSADHVWFRGQSKSIGNFIHTRFGWSLLIVVTCIKWKE